jgi:urocanate hydratase
VLSCRGWPQEAALRLLLNSLDPDVAERPEDLILSGAAGKAAADWDSFHAIVESLQRLASDQTLCIESGRLVDLSPAEPFSPRVLSGSATGDKSGDWLCAGTQTELPTLFEVYAAVARSQADQTLAGKLVLGAGMGGAGGAQGLAAALHGAAFLGIDADAEQIKRRVKSGYCEMMVNHLDEALRMLKNAVRQRKSVSVGLLGNCVDIFPELARRGIVPDVLADYTPAETHLGGYIPAGFSPADAEAARRANPSDYQRRVQQSIAIQHAGRRDLEKMGTRTIASTDVSCILQLLFDGGWRLVTWMALSGKPNDIARLDRLALEMFPENERVQYWLSTTAKYVRFQGLPARVAWLKQSDLGPLSRAANNLVARNELSAPVLFGCRWPAAAAHTASSGKGACWVWRSPVTKPLIPNQSSAQAAVADGSTDAAERLSLWTAT